MSSQEKPQDEGHENQKQQANQNGDCKHKKKDQQRKVFDNIHGFIRFQKRIWDFVDTPQFQKLRNIKQLGCLSYVFPGATHSRFQHCLGTGHLAKTFIEKLINKNPQIYKRYTEDQKISAIFTVTLAGIMHDIGHGPFSHTFDGQIVGKIDVFSKDLETKKWKHQIGSQIIFQHIAERLRKNAKNTPDQVITPDQIKRVVNLIHGTSDGAREWQFQLISNKTTGIDVDKLDYFRRDAFYLGAKGINIDHQLLMDEARIILEQDNGTEKPKQTICYPSKYALQVNDIFYSRYKLYKTYYLNNIAKGIQFMVMDALILVKDIFNFDTICRNIRSGDKWINDYVGLTDSILQRIQFLDQDSEKNKKYPQQIKEAKKILRRIKQRDIYRFVREVQTSVTQDMLTDIYGTDNKTKKIIEEAFDAENIAQYISKNAVIDRNRFHIAVTQAGYGLKHINPLNKVKFFRKQYFPYKILSEKDFRAQNISILYTKASSEKFAKLYVKDANDIQTLTKVNRYFFKYFDLKKQQAGKNQEFKNIFNHLNMGKTHFYPSKKQNNSKELQKKLMFGTKQNTDALA